MPRLDRLPESSRKNLLGLPVQVNDGTPFVPLRRPLAAGRLAIVSTAGLHRRGDRPFGPADQTYRLIAANTPTVDIVQSHTSLGFDRVASMRDVNISFPIDRLRELVGRGVLGALALLDEPAGPVLRDFPDDAEPGAEPPAPTQASAVTPAAGIRDDPAAEILAMLPHRARWLVTSSGRTAFGLAGVPLARMGDVVRFLQAFVAGGDADLPERPRDLPVPGFIRYCADDLKALYFEGRMAMKPAAGGDEIARWFWSETAIGQLLRRVRDRLDTSDDPRWKAAAFGVAR